MRRSRQGLSLIESVVSVALLAVVASGVHFLAMWYTQQTMQTNQDRTAVEFKNQLTSDVAPALENMVLTTGPLVSDLTSDTSVSASWQWESSEAVITQLQPQVVVLRTKGAYAVQDRCTTIQFDSASQVLTTQYKYRGSGQQNNGLGCQSTDLVDSGPITWRNISQAGVVRVGNQSLYLWVKQEGEWHSIDAGIIRP